MGDEPPAPNSCPCQAACQGLAWVSGPSWLVSRQWVRLIHNSCLAAPRCRKLLGADLARSTRATSRQLSPFWWAWLANLAGPVVGRSPVSRP